MKWPSGSTASGDEHRQQLSALAPQSRIRTSGMVALTLEKRGRAIEGAATADSRRRSSLRKTQSSVTR